MAKRQLNRIKAVQPSLETVIEVAQCLGVGVEELIRMPEKKEGGE